MGEEGIYSYSCKDLHTRVCWIRTVLPRTTEHYHLCRKCSHLHP